MVSSVSVIIPTYNRPQALRRAIESVLNQTLSPLEILVCEDGSSVETRELVESFNDPRVKWLPGLHAGRPAIPRNRGIQAAQGVWLAFLDDDDTWLPEKLEKQMTLVDLNNLLAVCTNAWRVTNQNQNELFFYQPITNEFDFKQLINNNWIISSSVLFHSKLIKKVIGFPESEKLTALEDYGLWLRISTFTKFGLLEEPLITYNDDPRQSLRKNDETEQQQKKKILLDLKCWAKRHHRIYCFIVLIYLIKLFFIQFYFDLINYLKKQIRTK